MQVVRDSVHVKELRRAEMKNPVQVERIDALLREFKLVAGYDERGRVSTVRRFDLDVTWLVRCIVGQYVVPDAVPQTV